MLHKKGRQGGQGQASSSGRQRAPTSLCTRRLGVDLAPQLQAAKTKSASRSRHQRAHNRPDERAPAAAPSSQGSRKCLGRSGLKKVSAFLSPCMAPCLLPRAGLLRTAPLCVKKSPAGQSAHRVIAEQQEPVAPGAGPRPPTLGDRIPTHPVPARPQAPGSRTAPQTSSRAMGGEASFRSGSFLSFRRRKTVGLARISAGTAALGSRSGEASLSRRSNARLRC